MTAETTNMCVTDLMCLRPGSCLHPVDRRAIFASLLAAGELPPCLRPHVDDLARRAAAVIAGDGPADDDVAAALNLRSAERLVRGELEGRILAGQDEAEIAEAMGLTEGAVAAYVGLYVGDRKRLDAGPWAVVLAYGEKGRRPLTIEDADALIRFAGLRLGVLGLVSVRDVLRIGPDRILDEDSEPGADDGRRREFLSARDWILSQIVTDPVEIVALWHVVNARPVPTDDGLEAEGRRLPSLWDTVTTIRAARTASPHDVQTMAETASRA